MDPEKSENRASLDSTREIEDSPIDDKDIESGLSSREGPSKTNEEKYLAPIRSKSRQPALSRSQTGHSARSERSYGGEDGYSCFREEPSSIPDDDEEKRWEVKWDGEKDPMNPRYGRSLMHKWAIVLIMASSALCVYVVVPTLNGPRMGGVMC
jgi:hypothetical protein